MAFIDPKAKIGNNVIIYENVHIAGESVIEENVTIFPNSYIDNSIIGKGSKVYSSIIEKSIIGSCSLIGPYVSLKKGAIVGGHTNIGPFCAIKNTEIGSYSKIVGHSQIVDANIGENVIVQPGTMILGENEKQMCVIDNNTVIVANSIITPPCKIK